MRRFFITNIFFILISGCQATLEASPNDKGKSTVACKSGDEIISLKTHYDESVTMCRVGGSEDCHDDHYLQAYEYGRPDINEDGLPDYLIRSYDGLSGINHNVSYFFGFLACESGGFRRILFGAYTTVSVSNKTKKNGMPVLDVSRECYSEDSNNYTKRSFYLSFDELTRSYGPPNENPLLQDFCTDYEAMLPGEDAHIGGR